MVRTWQVFSLPFCGSTTINHFSCDLPPVFTLACGDTSVNETAVYVAAVLFTMVPFLLTAVSYGKMTSNALKSPSARRRAKAFSTCSSNLTVVVLFHGTASTTYLQLKPNESEETGKLKNQSEETGTRMSFSTQFWSQCWIPFYILWGTKISP